MPRDLHPSLTEGPVPKPICAGCGATEDTVLAPVNGSKTMMLCMSCAGSSYVACVAETLRRAAMVLVDAVAPQVPA